MLISRLGQEDRRTKRLMQRVRHTRRVARVMQMPFEQPRIAEPIQYLAQQQQQQRS